MRGAIVAVLCGWPALAHAQPGAPAPQPCFEESNAFAVRLGVTRLRRLESNADRGSGPIAELEYRRRVSARASISALLAFSRVEYQREYSGTRIELDVTLVGVRLAGWLDPRVALGVDLGFSLFHHREPTSMYPVDRSDAGQFLGLFTDITVLDLDNLRVSVGARMSVGPTFLASALVGVDW